MHHLFNPLKPSGYLRTRARLDAATKTKPPHLPEIESWSFSLYHNHIEFCRL
jgi:hypothetical protein